jgi:hypothetical protein
MSRIEITDEVGIVQLAGEATVDGGDLFAVGSSYLRCTQTAVAAIASGVETAYPLVQAAKAGSDFEIDGMDATKINVLTDCWAIVSWAFDAQDDTNVGSVKASFFTIHRNAVQLCGFAGLVALNADKLGSEHSMVLTSPPVPLSAGDVLTGLAALTTDGDTWTLFPPTGDAPVSVVRVA